METQDGSRYLSKKISDKTGLDIDGITVFQKRIFEAIVEIVMEEGSITVPHFGIFKKGFIKEKIIHKTLGGDVHIKDLKRIKFLPCKELKDKINNRI
jgi:nucleoid DNA-binding protein